MINDMQPWKASYPISETFFDIMTLVNEAQLRNANQPIDLTVSGIETERMSLSSNALSHIEVTGLPFIEAGIIRSTELPE
jgi:hypothetical protein